jgi:hypothetical protein
LKPAVLALWCWAPNCTETVADSDVSLPPRPQRRASSVVHNLKGKKPMAEAAGDVLSLPTSHGQAEARHMGLAEAGQNRWCIRYPWSTETYYGTAEQVVAQWWRT